ncbi:hypothetical protein N2152v2_003530 [Parachlorella kessleri]
MGTSALFQESNLNSEQQHTDTYTSVPIGQIEALLPLAKFVGGGSFCRVYSLDNWTVRRVQGKPSPCFGKSHYLREKHAHLVLQGQQRVVEIHHTFSGCMLIPSSSGGERVPMEVMGFVQERCCLYSLNHLLCEAEVNPLRKTHLTLHLVSREMAALAEQLRMFDELGIVHQDINLANLLAHEAVPGSGDITFKFGDLNMCQWQQLLLDGNWWGGTVGFMPGRVQKMYSAVQHYPAPGVGEIYHDIYSLGKVLLRLLTFKQRLEPPFAKAKDDLEAEDAAVKQAAVQLLMQQNVLGDVPQELYAFGVLIGLAMAWDGPYADKEDILRLTPAAAADVMADWAAICSMWLQVQGGDAFWRHPGAVQLMAQLYVKLADHCSVPVLGTARVPCVHRQECEYINEVCSKFFSIGGGQRLAAVSACAQELLSAQEKQRRAATQQEHQQRGGAPAPSTLAMAQKRLDHVAPNSNRPGAAAGAAAVAAAATANPGKENAAGSQHVAGGKRKHSGSESSVNQVLRPRVQQSQPPLVAAPAAAAQPPPPEGEYIRLSHTLRLSDIFPGGRKPAGAPNLIGGHNSTALALAEAVQAMLAAKAGAKLVQLRHGSLVLNLTLADLPGRRGQQVMLRRSDFQALCANKVATSTWNATMKALTQSFQHQKPSVQGRITLLREQLGAIAKK